MSVTYSLDEVARTSDETAVLARFDAATLTALRLLSILFTLFGFPHLIEASTSFRRVLGGASFLLGILCFMAVRKKANNRFARFVKHHIRAAAMIFLSAETALLIIFNSNAGNEGMLAFAILAPLFALLLRLLPAEHVLLHVLLAAISVFGLVLWPLKDQPFAQFLFPPLLVTAGAMALALYISRRVRRSVVREWTERRGSAREQIRMRDELRYARELQLSMLPERAPELEWADVSGISLPATEVGGDYYDYFVDGDRIALVCGDVAGHGMASGLVLSALRTGFTLLRDSLHAPDRVLQRLHDLVVQTTRRRMLVTVAVVLFDRLLARVTIASAGHPPVIVRRADGSVATVDLYSPPLGVRLPVTIPHRKFEVSPGDVLVLHTDGIYETRNGNDEVYGLERLQRVVGTYGGESAEALRDAIVRDVSEFRGSHEQEDDITLVVCRITQVSPA